MRGARPFAGLEAAAAAGAALEPGETVVVAASGGPDSTALAALTAGAARTPAAQVVLAHVDHRGRAGSAQDEAVVLALAAQLRVRAVTAALAPGPAAEGRLRDARYAALADIARAAGARRIFTAHHAEDQTESVLLALFRGAGPGGLGGMAPERPLAPGLSLVRPLLGVAPHTLRAYCEAERLPYVLDPTNRDERFRRNAVRAALAGLRAAFPSLDTSVARSARVLREQRAGGSHALLREHLRAELAHETGDARDVTFERLDAAAGFLERGEPGRLFLRRGVEVVVE